MRREPAILLSKIDVDIAVLKLAIGYDYLTVHFENFYGPWSGNFGTLLQWNILFHEKNCV